MKKTQDELFAQFQREFETKRKGAIINLWWQIPLWTIMNTIFILFMLVVAFPSSLGIILQNNDYDIPVAVVILVVMGILNFVCFEGAFEIFRVKTLLKEKIEYFHKQTELRNQNWGFRDLITVPNIRPFKCVYDERSITIWIMLARRYEVDHDFQVLAKIDDEITKQCNAILEAEVWIKVYRQTKEKTFWQYLKSMKWIKKSKNK